MLTFINILRLGIEHWEVGRGLGLLRSGRCGISLRRCSCLGVSDIWSRVRDRYGRYGRYVRLRLCGLLRYMDGWLLSL
jgi:hypothetical protein